MFNYTISKHFDAALFRKACDELEKYIDNIVKEHYFYDFLDGDMKQEYLVNGKRIIVNNDSDVDALYIESEIDLSDFVICIR